ncbi:MAG: trigger factor, partial [Candidatus Hydrogenedentes bacterium]|nr:trigger factor [Candidatus Hydrogenedentota bacterium]
AYEGLEIERPLYEVPDSDVDATIESMQTRYGRFEPLEDGAAESGDQVIIDFEGKVDGEDFEGNSAENYPYILGSQRFSPEMEVAMTGAKSGETVTADVTFPEDYRSKEIAGKMAKFEIKVNEIKRRILPELDDEFAKKVGHETLVEMRDAVRKRIGENADDQVKEFMQQQARVKLVECSTFELPQSQVKNFIESEYSAMEQRMVEQHAPAEAIEEHREEMQKAADEQGLLTAKSMYAVRALAEKENITVTDKDFEEYAEGMSTNYQQSPDVMKEYLLSDDMRSMTEFQIIEKKALAKVVEKASIVDKPVTEDKEADTAEEDKEKADA